MDKILKTNLLALFTAYCRSTGAALSTVSRYAGGDSSFHTRLDHKARESFTVRKYDEAVAWFDGHWPAGTSWPKGVDRPRPKSRSRRAKLAA